MKVAVLFLSCSGMAYTLYYELLSNGKANFGIKAAAVAPIYIIIYHDIVRQYQTLGSKTGL